MAGIVAHVGRRWQCLREGGGRRNIQTRFHDGKSGYLAQSSHPLYFDLGDASRVDRIEIRWPPGRVQVVEGPVEVNRTLRIVEE